MSQFNESENADAVLGSVPENEPNGTTESSAVELDRDQIPPTDITFDCPHCGKSLSIEPRGAGLVIACTDCGKPVTVPIPEGLEIDDFDESPEELYAQLVSARQKLLRAEERVFALEVQVAELKGKLKEVEVGAKDREDDDNALFAILHTKLASLAAIQANSAALAKEISTLIAEEE